MEVDRKEFLRRFCGDWDCREFCKLSEPQEDCPYSFMGTPAFNWTGTCNPCYMEGKFVPVKDTDAVDVDA